MLSIESSCRNSEIMIMKDGFMKLCIVFIALGSEIILGSTYGRSEFGVFNACSKGEVQLCFPIGVLSIYILDTS